MLDDDKQIEAFGILSAQGAVTPQPIIVCGEIVMLADALAQTITPLLVAGTPYPASITGYTAKIAGYISQATQAGSAAAAFSKALEPYVTPSELLQMKMGGNVTPKETGLIPLQLFRWLQHSMIALPRRRYAMRYVLFRLPTWLKPWRPSIPFWLYHQLQQRVAQQRRSRH